MNSQVCTGHSILDFGCSTVGSLTIFKEHPLRNNNVADFIEIFHEHDRRNLFILLRRLEHVLYPGDDQYGRYRDGSVSFRNFALIRW
jgi:hypothetical protein